MKSFRERVSALFFKEKGISIDNAAYMEMPEKKEDYILSKIIGNVNLAEGRFMTKTEADSIVDRFLAIPIP